MLPLITDGNNSVDQCVLCCVPLSITTTSPPESYLVMLQSFNCSQILKDIQAQIYLTALNYLVIEHDLELNLCILQQGE